MHRTATAQLARARVVPIRRPAPLAPAPSWKGLFLEPAYTDGQPYADAGLDDDEEEEAGAA